VTTPIRRVTNRPFTADHSVQFFDAADTLGAAAARFLHDGLVAGADGLLVAKPSTIQAIAAGLAEHGLSLRALADSGRLTLLDAAATLHAFMDGPNPNPARFDAAVGTVVRQRRATSHGPLRVYGEMVDMLATEGNFRGAEQLERLWTVLLDSQPCLLLCGYLAPHFATPNGADALRAICECHHQVRHDPADLLATWLLDRMALA
jgi:MEDS: MEthanogen/methylotroph, DcmR Sensory domain